MSLGSFTVEKLDVSYIFLALVSLPRFLLTIRVKSQACHFFNLYFEIPSSHRQIHSPFHPRTRIHVALVSICKFKHFFHLTPNSRKVVAVVITVVCGQPYPESGLTSISKLLHLVEIWGWVWKPMWFKYPSLSPNSKLKMVEEKTAFCPDQQEVASLTFWVCSFHGSFCSRRGILLGRRVRVSCRVTLCIGLLPKKLDAGPAGLFSWCHGNQLALRPRRRGAAWSAHATTAVANISNKKSKA